ncbi:MAG: DEAD/DEAH box helicase, partial [Candidatus Thorarchaeota archaeon]
MRKKTLTITLKNNLRLTGIQPELKNLLMDKLEITNPKWIENARMGRWNRGTPKVLRFYDKVRDGGLWIPRGYIRQLIFLCRHHRVIYRINDQRRHLPPLDFSFNGKLRPFQREAVELMLSKEFGTLSSPTGSGKTIMALWILAQRSQPALIVVHTKDLAIQWIDRIANFLNISEDEVGTIGGGKMKIGKKVTVALVQSLYKCADKVSPHIGHLIVDECHRTPSRTFTEAVTEFDSRYMLGLTATPWRRDKLSKLIFWHLGDLHHQVNKKYLVEIGDVLSAEIIFRETDFTPFFDPVTEYSKMLSELTSDDKRNHLIAADIAQEIEQNNGVCLVLSDRKKHCETLQAILKYKFNVPSELLTGDLNTNEREDVLHLLNKGQVKVLIATGQLIGEGYDCKDLSTLFLATPVRFSGRVLQYLGRILRPAPGKNQARVFDYVDVKVDTLKAAANARSKVYR